MKTCKETAIEVLEKLIAQGGCSYKRLEDKSKYCLYRNPNGRRCAAGQCIPDKEYYPEMENETVTGLIKKDYIFDGYNTDVLSALQTAHDNIAGSGDEKEVHNLKRLLDFVKNYIDSDDDSIIELLEQYDAI